jgi:effector-binding domain-containing protein
MGRVAAVALETVAVHPMAAVAARTDFAGLPKAILGGLDKVYAVLRAGRYGPRGCNTVYYAPMPDGGSVFDILAGVRLDQPFPGPVGEVVAAETPAGETAHATYFGDYSQMHPAHLAAQDAARAAGRQLTGDSWEVYGDWSNNPEELRTDIYYLLKGQADG